TYQNALDTSAVTVVVTQTQAHTVAHPVSAPGDVPFYVFPLSIRLLLNDGTTSDVSVDVDAVTKTFVLPNPGRKPVVSITLDPGKDLLKSVESTGPA
ncbi:MAG TPA: hypothetical protein VFZ57_01945, partial [Thermoanaerobaculia bacterium]|nr:hypothetical protein [Thermoanaerobaculia bacterium]